MYMHGWRRSIAIAIARHDMRYEGIGIGQEQQEGQTEHPRQLAEATVLVVF